MSQDYLVDLLNAYWFAPTVALWRAVELRAVTAACPTVDHPLVDVGCGDGLIAQVLAPAWGLFDVGFDPWSKPLRRAAACGAYHHVDRAHGDAMPYREDAFATAFSNSVLEHIPHVQPVLHEVARILKPGGRFILTVPSNAFPHMLDGYVRRRAMGDPEGADAYVSRVNQELEHHHYHTPAEWEALLSKAGLTLLATDYYMPEPAERFWDRMNRRYQVGPGSSPWRLLVSPHLRPLRYQDLLRRLVVKVLGRRWRPTYEMDVPAGSEGGGLLIQGER